MVDAERWREKMMKRMEPLAAVLLVPVGVIVPTASRVEAGDACASLAAWSLANVIRFQGRTIRGAGTAIADFLAAPTPAGGSPFLVYAFPSSVPREGSFNRSRSALAAGAERSMSE